MNRLMSVLGLAVFTAIAAGCQTTSNEPKVGLNEATYLIDNPDVPELIKSGKFKSALDHYEKVGKSGKNAKGDRYESTFAGTSGNDTVQGMGAATHTHFLGVGLDVDSKKGGDYPVIFNSLGKGEVDILVGNTEGENEFILGSYITSATPKAESFYVGNGNGDYARIQGFKKGRDSIYLSGLPAQYKLEPSDGTVRISTKEGDLVGIVEGVDKLRFGKISKKYGQFAVK